MGDLQLRHFQTERKLETDQKAVDAALAGFERKLEEDRARFLAEARRVARKILIVDAARREDIPPELMQERELKDGSRHTVYKRYFTPEELVAELGGGRVLHGGQWFVAVLSSSEP